MPTNGMNTGTDYTITYYDGASGALINLGDVQNVKFTALKHDIKSSPYNKVPRYAFVGDGFKVDFEVTRTGSQLEDFAILSAANFNAGIVISPGFLNQTTNNPDGTISRYQYTNFVIFLEDPGDVARDKVTTQKLVGMASDKIKIA